MRPIQSLLAKSKSTVLTVSLAAGLMVGGGAAWGAATAAQPTSTATADTTTVSRVWSGTTSGSYSRASTEISLTYTWHGTFWYVVDSDGQVHGYASVSYQPAFSAQGLNQRVTEAVTIYRSMASVFGAIPAPEAGEVAAVAGAEKAAEQKASTDLSGLGKAAADGAGNAIVGGFQGVVGTFTDAMSIKSGPIAGHLTSDSVQLNWADGQQDTDGLDVVIDTLAGNIPVTSSKITMANPWSGDGRDLPTDGVQQIVGSTNTNSSSGGVPTQLGGFWEAHQD
jgi:hypothetical protein